MKVEIKRNTRQIARASNEIYRRTQQKQVTAKEKELLNEPKKIMGRGRSSNLDVKTV